MKTKNLENSQEEAETQLYGRPCTELNGRVTFFMQQWVEDWESWACQR
jgi:hypothetical protein